MSDAPGPGPEAGAARAEPAGAALSVDVAGLLAQLARSFALLLPVYALGYLGLSFSWVLLALALLVWCRRSRGLKATRLCRALALLEDEERAVRLGVRACDLPAWVSARRGARRHPHPASLPGRACAPPCLPAHTRVCAAVTSTRRWPPGPLPPPAGCGRPGLVAVSAPPLVGVGGPRLVAGPPVRCLSPRCPSPRWLSADPGPKGAFPRVAPSPGQTCTVRSVGCPAPDTSQDHPEQTPRRGHRRRPRNRPGRNASGSRGRGTGSFLSSFPEKTVLSWLFQTQLKSNEGLPGERLILRYLKVFFNSLEATL